jgi:hypothetical protein
MVEARHELEICLGPVEVVCREAIERKTTHLSDYIAESHEIGLHINTDLGWRWQPSPSDDGREEERLARLLEGVASEGGVHARTTVEIPSERACLLPEHAKIGRGGGSAVQLDHGTLGMASKAPGPRVQILAPTLPVPEMGLDALGDRFRYAREPSLQATGRA